MSCPRISSVKAISVKAIECAVLLFVLSAVPDRPVQADVFKLVQGGQLQGIWLNEESGESQPYQVRTSVGIRIVLDRSMVREVVREPALERQYQQMVARHGNDVDGQWAIAQWCREHGLKERRRYHLQRILRLEPNHVGARLGLGYSQVRGNWVTQEEFMREQGYVQYRGRWQLPQRVELMEVQRKRELAERQWYRQLVQWRADLGTERAERASVAIVSINDPHAVRGLRVVMRSESSQPARLLCVQALRNIGTPDALSALLDIVLTDSDEEVVCSCLDCLAEARHPLVLKQLLATLRHENNALVNRAAMALERLGEDDTIAPLIDALVTRHMRLLPIRDSDGDVELKMTPVDIPNRDVLTALVKLTEFAGFGFDKKAWKQWRYLQVQQDHTREAQTVELRRTKS